MESLPNFELFTGQARRAIWLAYQEAQRFDHDYLASEHLLAGVLREGSLEIAKVFRDQGIATTEIVEKLEPLLAQAEPRPLVPNVCLTPRAVRALNAAVDLALHVGDRRANSPQLLQAIINDPDSVARKFLDELGFDAHRGAADLRDASVAPNRDQLVTSAVSESDLNRPESSRVDPTAAQLAQLLTSEMPRVDLDMASGAVDINPALAESDFQLFLTQLMLAVTMGLTGGYILHQTIDAMAAVAIAFALVACFRNSVLGLLAGATLGGMIGQKIQPGNRLFDTPIEALVPLVLIGGFLGSFIGNFWRRFTPRYLHPSETHQKPPGVV